LLEKVRHPNVLQFVGAVTQNKPMMIVSEYHPKVSKSILSLLPPLKKKKKKEFWQYTCLSLCKDSFLVEDEHTDWHGKEKSREGGNMNSLSLHVQGGTTHALGGSIALPQNFKFASKFDTFYNKNLLK